MITGRTWGKMLVLLRLGFPRLRCRSPHLRRPFLFHHTSTPKWTKYCGHTTRYDHPKRGWLWAILLFSFVAYSKPSDLW